MQPLARWLDADNKRIEGVTSVQEQVKAGSFEYDIVQIKARKRGKNTGRDRKNDPAEVDRTISEQQKAQDALQEFGLNADI